MIVFEVNALNPSRNKGLRNRGTNLTPDNFPYPNRHDDVCEENYLKITHHYVINGKQKAITWYMNLKES